MAVGADISTWIATRSIELDDPHQLLGELIGRLLEAGVPVWRLSLGIATIDPQLRGLSLTVWRDRPPSVDTAANDAQGEASFQQSPIFYAQSRRLRAHRWRLDDLRAAEAPPLLRRLAAEGASDFVLRLMPFGTSPLGISGAAFSFATDRAGGFADADVALVDSLLPALGLAARCFSAARTAQEALGVYLGARTASRVLAGEIRRGQGQRISAAVLLTDLRGFTTLTDREDALRVVGWLDEHFHAIGTAVDAQGGEVLKFLGDGLLAIFPFGAEAGSGTQACDRALACAEQALAETARINAGRQRDGGPRLDLDTVLNAGEVVYGNVGAARRLDFTVIGSAVNEAARMEGHCQALGRNLLLSDSFARLCSRPTARVGTVALRGLSGARELWEPATIRSQSGIELV